MFRKSCTSLRDFSFGGAPEVCQEFWLVRKWIPGLLLIANVWSTGWGQALTLNGIELGMTQEQVRALHGKPDLQGSDTWSYCYSPGATWPSIQTQVTFDAQGRVCAVQGSTLESENHRYSTNSLAEIQQRWPGLHLAVDQNRRFHLSRESEVRESDPDRLRVQLGPYHPAVWLALLERLPGKADFVASVRELKGIILKGPDPLSRPPEGILSSRFLQGPARNPAAAVQFPETDLWQESEAPVPPWLKRRVRVDAEERAQGELIQELFNSPHLDWPEKLARHPQVLTPLFLSRCRQRAEHHLGSGICVGDGLDLLSICEQASQFKGAPLTELTHLDHREGILGRLADRTNSRGCILGVVARPGKKTNFWRAPGSEWVANAQVVVGYRWITHSNEHGAFAIWNLPTGPHRVTVRIDRLSKSTRVLVKAYPAGLENAGLVYGWAPTVDREYRSVAIQADCPEGVQLEHAELQSDWPLEGYFESCRAVNAAGLEVRSWMTSPLDAESVRFNSSRHPWRAKVRLRNGTDRTLRQLYLLLDLDGTESRVLVPRPWSGRLAPGAHVDLSLPAQSSWVRGATLHVTYQTTRLYSHPELP